MSKKVCAALFAALAVLAVAVLGSASASTNKSAKKSPILVGLVAPGAGSPVVNSQASVSADLAYIRATNAHGGIDGHPLKLIYCNDKNDPNLTISCAQKMISSHVIMLAGGDTLDGAQLTTYMNKAGIPEVGQLVYDATSLNSPNEFIMTSTEPGYVVVMGWLAKHHVKVSMLGSDNSTASQLYAGLTAATASLKNPWISQTLVPPTVPDMHPYVSSALKGNPGAIQSFLGIPQDPQVVSILGQMHSKVKWVTAAGVSSAAGAAAQGETADIQNMISFGNILPLQDTKNQLISLFLSQMASYHKATGDSYSVLAQQSSGTFTGWLSLWVLQKLVDEGKLNANHLTSATVMHAFQTVKNINMAGVMPPWTPNAKGPQYEARISDPYYYIWTFTNGGAKVKFLTSKAVDAPEALAGQF
jgi:ABC-type branched-subunit amino acid transport system substrate-binding protein